MRRIILRSLLGLVGVCALGLIWIFGGRQIALALDRLGTAEVERIPITDVRYDSGGNLHLGSMLLSITGPDNQPWPLRMAPDSKNKLILSVSGKSFPLGDLVPADQENVAGFGLRLDKEDDVSIIVRRSYLSWPSPFDFNFMTGHAPSWKRHQYRQLAWKKQSGARLELLWRHEQYFYPNEGWTAGSMTHEGSTGLIRAVIEP